MQGEAPHSYTHDHEVANDGIVAFKCSTDSESWPWLALHPFDPIVVQSINFWASVETATARGTWDPDKWSALTQMTWQCGEIGVGHAVRGIGKPAGTDGSPGFHISFFDDDDALVYEMGGKGVIFQTRDFEAWRAKSKKKMSAPVDTTDFVFAPAETVGVAEQDHCFVSPLHSNEKPSVQALVSKRKGFMPTHPYHSGSGDHVNSNQLADVVRQFVNLISGEKTLLMGGEIEFNRYVELDRPFDVVATEDDKLTDRMIVTVEQARRQCAAFDMTVARTP